MQQQEIERTTYSIEDSHALDDEQHVDTMTINMGPQHPSTHGVLRLILTWPHASGSLNNPTSGI